MLLLKTIGIACIITGFGSWGISGARCLDQRVEQLKELRLALGFLEKEISCMYSPLSQALARTAHFCRAPAAFLFEESAHYLHEKDGVTANEAWLKGLNRLRHDSELADIDFEVLMTLSAQLGSSDASQQTKVLTLVQEELKVLEERARNEAESGRKVRTYGGFILGAVVVLLFL